MRTTFILHGGFGRGVAGVDKSSFYSEILKDAPEGAQVLLVCFAKEDDSVAGATEKVKAEFLAAKWQQHIHIAVAEKETFAEQIKNADAVYFHGGTTLRLLNSLLQFPGLRDWLRGKIVAGESAGANVWCTTFYSPSADVIEGGLAFLPIKIIPHYTDAFQGILDNVGEGLEELLLPEYEYKVFTVDL
jgi:peptidase E